MFGLFRRRRRGRTVEIAPEDIFLDASNLPGLSAEQFEGRVVRPVSLRAVFGVGAVFLLILGGFSIRAFTLQVAHGDTYAEISRENTLERNIIFATRGLIYDRTGREIAWNEAQLSTSTAATSSEEAVDATYALRKYSPLPGLSLLIGFLRYPSADAAGNWWRDHYSGVSGIELAFDEQLAGRNGSRMLETDALGDVQRENIVSPPQPGEDLTLSIDAQVQSKLFEVLSQHSKEMGFQGGAAVIMDVRTGELLALTSFPEYDNQAFTDGDAKKIAAAATDERSPLLNRAVSGLYTPGSIVKPMFAVAALNEHLISPEKEIVSTGAISLPNPYDPEHPSLFRDWTVHGAIDMREALAVSSDEYFYTIGGGYGDQAGLGIKKIDEYATLFGLSSLTGIHLVGEKAGVVPTPEWKEEVFGKNDPWRIGDTYHTVIGQYGFQITPLEAVRYISSIANGGKLLTPHLLASSTPEFTEIGIPDEYLQVAREGMRLAVTSDRSDATVRFFNMNGIELAAKTGTAQLGMHNEWMNSWSVGFWPASDPHYAYAVVLEKAPAATPSGAAPGMIPFFQWLIAEHPEYTH